jgi:hypothetical protein
VSVLLEIVLGRRQPDDPNVSERGPHPGCTRLAENAKSRIGQMIRSASIRGWRDLA